MNPSFGGPPIWGVRGPGGPFGGGLDVPEDPLRQARLDQILPALHALRNGILPTHSINVLKTLVADLKEEGNSLFREKAYVVAGEYYTYALTLARNMETELYCQVERELLSTIFSNRAACCLKLDYHDDAVRDTEYAISLNKDNIKAYFRKATALKAKKVWVAALAAAEEGQAKASSKNKAQENKEFSEIIREISSHLPKPVMEEQRNFATAAKTHSVLSQPQQVVVPLPSQPKPPATSKVQAPPPMVKTTAVASAAAQPAPTNGQQNGRSQPAEVDESWLEGTNVGVTRAAQDRNKEKKKKKKKGKKTIRANSSNRFAYLERSESESSIDEDEDDDGSEENEEQSSEEATVINIPQLPPSLDRPKVNGFSTKKKKGASANNDGFGMGLDDFTLPSSLEKDIPPVLSSSSSSLQSSPRVKPQQFNNQPTELRAPAPKTTAPPPQQMSRRMKPPLDPYEFKLACSKCYVKLGEGILGYRHYPVLSHPCAMDILLVRLVHDNGGLWLKIRPRPNRSFPGKYRMCQHFLSDRPCRVSEEFCSFTHSIAEIDAWSAEREGHIDLISFITDQRNQVHAAASQRLANAEPVPPPRVPNQNQQMPMYSNVGNGQRPPRFQQQQQQQPPLQLQEMSVQTIPFPLKDKFNFKLVCHMCLKPAEFFGLYIVQNISHTCSEEMLAIQEKSSLYWVQVRERKNHRMFPGNYLECRYFCDRVRPMPCPVGIDNCSFAHNLPEQILWTLEKDGVFNIQEFMIQNKTASQGLTVEEVFHKHKGHFRFLCGVCFFGHLISFQRSENNLVCSNSKTPHPWVESRVLVHVSYTGNIELIANRPFTHKTAFYLLCHRQRYCAKRVSCECKFAHSLVERDVWVLERDTEWSRDTIVQEYTQLQQMANPLPVQNARAQHSQSPAEGSPVRQPATAADPLASAVPERCPFKIIAVCSMCWKNGVRSEQDGTKDRCNAKKRSHIWGLNIAYMLVPHNKIIRQLPKKIPSQLNFIICKHIREKRNCDYSAGTCQFAHSEEEIEIWKWMVKNQVKKLEDLLEQKPAGPAKVASPARKISEGQSVVTAAWAQQPAQLRPQATSLPLDLVQNAHYCHYCSVSCNSEKQWVEHCASDKHMFNVNSDKEHQWNYRQPPWGISANQYELCPRHQEGRCRYSHLPDMYNLCKYAHSQEELDEWKERWDWRQMKREMARQEGVYSYMEELLEDYDQAQSALSVITEELPDVEIKVSSELKIYKQDKNATHSWDFYVSHKKGLQLERVALLQNKDRLHFVLFGEDLNDTCQIASGDSFLAPECSGITYKVRVLFKGGMFGSFMQWVSFDFGGRPVLIRKLNVELGVQDVQEKVKQLRAKLNFDRWTAENREIVSFDMRAISAGELETELLKTYKAPTSADAVVNQQTIGVELNRHNYVHKMRKMLQLEELTRHHIISSYNLKTELELISVIDETTVIYVRSGELFARVPLNNQLSEDTDAGKLILTSVRNILIAPMDSKNRQVYEAIFVQKDNFDYDGRGKDYIYICLSQRCCSDLELSSGGRLQVEIQFQMNRLPFCFMHYAISQLESTDKVFPDVSKINPEWNEKQTISISSAVLNTDQIKVIKHVIAQRNGYTPPMILYGPFGTGKTETLAQAALLLLDQQDKQQMNVRILICTHSNSAADLYILKHFDEYAQRKQKAGEPVPILRVYALERRLNTVPPQIQSYCLISHDRTSFVAPTAQDIKKHQVVITTLHTSLVLSQLGLSGEFTHIFLDEAGQALETELIMPVTLASEQTCIVLAGDHMQMSPHVYSREARRQGFHRSLLERLYRHYENYARHLDITSPLNVLLSVNYRSKMEILRFISAVFYGSPDALKSRSVIPNTTSVPLTFYAAQGREVQDSDSTSYYNMAEIEEVVDRVEELYENWPSEWGPRKANSIGIVTPYFDQVSKIRVALRRRRRELREVTVERVMNVQGKEFQVLFISTVRTRHIADTAPRRVLNSADCDGEVGDFGFLSDPKLLNTAFTRAQAMVAVVGDPVALCSIGECMSIWRTFLKHCQNLRSIYPNNITLDSIKSQVVSLMNTPEGENLRQLALLYRSVKQGVEISDGEYDSDSDEEKDRNGLKRLMTDDDQNPFDTLLKGGFFEDWSLDYHVEPDDIIKQLAKEVVKVRRKSSNEMKRNVQLDLEDTPLKIECIKVEEEEGHAVVTYDPNKSSDAEPRKRRLRGADDCDADFDSDSDLSDNEDVSERMVYTEYSVKQLNDFLSSDPVKYKRCIFKIENSQRMYAKVTDASVLGGKGEIKICSRLHCGRAFNNDEVVVEIFNKDDEAEGEEDQEVKEHVLVGKVTGILKRSINPKYRMFVCRVEQGNTGLMIPLNRGIPKIYNLETHNRMMKSKKGHVCVYTFTKDKEIIFHHYEPVDCTNPDAKLFIVRYLKWEAKFYSPLGIVVGVLPAGNTVENGMKILNIEHYVSSKFKEETTNEINRYFHSSYQIPETAYDNRVDCRSKLTFTVDPPGSEDLDDALSIEPQPQDKYVVGVHIADVSYFIKKDSYLDTEAKARGVTFYPVGEKPVHMIPQRLATDLCSLQPNKDRLALSLFITVNHEGSVERVQTRRSVIRSKYRLNYHDVEGILKSTGRWDGNLVLNVFMLHRIAQVLRRKRMGNLGLYQQFDPEASQTPEAHLMVEEIMINANHLVADLLMQKFSFVPLRNQLNPNELEMNSWRLNHVNAASNCLALRSPFLPLGSLCRCQGVCICVPPPNDGNQPVTLSQEVVDQLKHAVASGDPDTIRRILLDPMRHPDQAVALVRLWQIQERSAYVCSGDIPEYERRHHSLNLFGYTHFTSPIRRYMDLVVHRMVAAHIDNQPSPYSQNDIRSICDQMTDIAIKANRYEQATHSLHLSAVLQKHSIILYPVVESITEQHIQLSFPTVGDLTSSKGRMKLSHFNPAERPAYEESTQKLELKFSWRIYDNSKERSVFYKSSSVPLNPNRFTMQMTREMWQQMIEAIQQDDRNTLLVLAHRSLQELQQPGKDGAFGYDVSSEIPGGTMINHFSSFNLNLEPCAVMRVQIGADLCRGFLSPRIQLVNLTPRLDICLEHRSDPIACFAGVTNIQASKQNYGDVESYQRSWLPVLAMEAAHNAATCEEAALIHSVDVKWHVHRGKKGDHYTGSFSVPTSFCSSRQLRFSGITGGDASPWGTDEEIGEMAALTERVYDFLCIRYRNLEVKEQPDTTDLRVDIDTSLPVTWVGHCLSTKVIASKKELLITVYFKLHHSSMPFPEDLLQNVGHHKATIEWIPKSLPYRRMEKGLYDLSKATQLVQDIAMGRNPEPQANENYNLIRELLERDLSPMNLPNHEQQRALQTALLKPFTLIQGPPGTGKSVTSARLAVLYVLMNRLQPPVSVNNPKNKKTSPQILYCGPSNKSVDVVAGYLKRLGHQCPRLVRVYGESIERQEFPLPNDPSTHRRKTGDATMDPNLKGIALHHLIRMNGKKHSRQILEYDDFFRMKPEQVAQQQVSDYLRLVSQAEAEEIMNAEIILCTASSASASKITHSSNVTQIIVDECGMCTELESLIPLVAHKAHQVVLVGDHQQLRPIVLDDTARNLGLERSMFERYSDKAIMLTTQYRMHEAISYFPSHQFYKDLLQCGRNEQTKPSALKFWPNGRDQPIAFIHVAGKEEAQSVATADGSEQSKSNIQEAIQATRISRLLVRRFHVRPEDVVVLTQYRAQAAEVKRQLLEKGETDICVSTVVASQGSEWDYVVLSTVRSLPSNEIEERPTNGWRKRNLGFIMDEHQINVAITRARKGLILIGNKHLLQCDEMWKHLLDFYDLKKKIVDAKDFMTLGK